MVNIILCGPGASNKHDKLIEKLSRESHRMLHNHRYIQFIANMESIELNVDIQREIIEKQCIQEQSDCTREFITDNCVISGLVNLSQLADEDVAEIISKNSTIAKTIDVYKSSLVVLLGPCSNNSGDTSQTWEKMKKDYVSKLMQLRIPFIDVTSSDLSERTQIVKEALKGNKLKLHSSRLKLNKSETEVVQTDFSFYIQPTKKGGAILIPTLNIYEHHYDQRWTDVFQQGKTCRFIQKCGHKDLICVHFDISVRSSITQKTLLNGISLNGELYSFLGCSSSGLRERKCYMLRGEKENAKRVLDSTGNFSQIKPASKRLARIGLLFSSVRMTNIRIEDESMIEEKDIKHNNHIFSDGCGKIGLKLAKKVFSELSDNSQPNGYTPSVFQIRLQGLKGTLALDKTIPESSIVVRPSMRKFETTAHPFLGICDYSKANVFGHLNKQYIMLLSGLGVPDSVFLSKQEKHFEVLKIMTEHSESAIMVLQLHNQFELAIEISKYGKIEMIPEDRQKVVRSKLKKIQSEAVSKLTKLNILVPESRNLYGIVDSTETLDYGQCFLRVTISGKPTTVSGQIAVCKNPCYLLGDVRVLTAVNDADFPKLRQLNHLVDCIVFPGRGKRPHADEIAGSDLDGDQFFVTWDKDLIPKNIVPPYSYPAAGSKHSEEVTWDSIIACFSQQNETKKMTGRVHNCYNQWANIKNVTSEECVKLGQLFSVVIDSNKSGGDIGNMKGLTQPADKNEDEISKYVWQRMEIKALEFSEEYANKVLAEPKENEVSDEFVDFFVDQTFTNISEFDKFNLCWQHLMRMYSDEQQLLIETFVQEYQDRINFSHFSITEREDAISRGVQRKFVMNALNKSHILSENELHHFQMDSYRNTWNAYCINSQEHFEWNRLLKALTTNDMTLIAIELPDNVKVVLQFLVKQEIGSEQKVIPGTISALFFSNDFDYAYRYVLGSNYMLNLTDDTLQLYQGETTATFVFIKTTDRKLVKKKWDKPLSDEIVNCVSVHLPQFNKHISKPPRPHPLITKVPFVALEMFVQSLKRTSPYWDIFDANDLVEVPELQEVEEEEDSDEQIEVAQNHIQDMLTSVDDSDMQTLQNAAEHGKPLHFMRLLKENSHAEDDLYQECIYLLETIRHKIAPLSLSEEIKNILIEIIFLVLQTLSQPSQILSLSMELSKLYLFDISEQIMCRPLEKEISIGDFLQLISMWEALWFIDVDKARQFFIKCFENLELENENNDSDSQINITRYISSLGLLNVDLLLTEFQTNEQNITSAELPARFAGLQSSIARLKLDQNSSKDGVISFNRTEPLEAKSKITKGKYVAISRQRDIEKFGCSRPVYCVGQIQSLNTVPFSLSVRVEGKIPLSLSGPKSAKVRYWRVDIIGNVTTYKRSTDAMKQIMSSENDKTLINFISLPREVAVETLMTSNVTPSFEETDILNQDQREAVISAFKQKISLIQGPPGTGKTTVACAIIKSVCSQKLYKGILVTAETNVAVDNLARRLKDELLVLRVGSTDSIDSELYDISLEGQIKMMANRTAKKAKFVDDKGDIHLNKQLIGKVLSSAEVVLTTCAGAADVNLQSSSFEFVLLDEATLTMDTTLLCSLCHGAKHLVMIGDPNQLGPAACETIKTPLIEIEAFKETLFQRIQKSKTLKTHVLKTQYRMHPTIMKFPSDEFYDGKLEAADSTKSRSPVIFPWPKPDAPICFIDIQDTECRNGTSYYNEKEVEVVEKIVMKLLQAGRASDDCSNARPDVTQIGVLTFYQAQVYKLKTRLKQGVMVNSVDGFQGQEKDVIVVSTVRCNDRQSVGFSGDARRINVLLTRAKRGLIVVGNETTLRTSDIWSRWLENVPKLSVEELDKTNQRSESQCSSNARGRGANRRGRGRRN